MKKFYDFLFRCFDVLCAVIILHKSLELGRIVAERIHNKLYEIKEKKEEERMLKKLWEEAN